MLVVTARLFKDNQLVGYRLSDGQSTQDLTKQQAWMYAKNKQIFNVVATGTEQDPGLSGIDGFELKSLPQIKWQEKHINGNGAELGKSLLVTNTLYDGIKGIGPFGILVIGYKIKNIGSQDIYYTRIAATEDHTKTEEILKPMEETCINRAELTYLCTTTNIGTKLANGKVVASSKKKDRTEFERLSSYYFAFDKEIKEPVVNKDLVKQYIGRLPSEDGIRLDVRTFLEPEIIEKYFCPPIVQKPEDDKFAHQQESIKKLQNSKSVKDIFNAFKR